MCIGQYLTVMKSIKTWLIALLLILGCFPRAHAAPATRDTYCNPLDVLVADPFIYRDGDIYYLYGTASDSGLLVWTSRNLVDWQLRGFAYRQSPQTWGRQHFWAPELFKHNGKYYLHFTAQGGDKLLRRIVLSEANSPLGPFHEIKAPWFDTGQSVIDSDVFQDDDGKLYLYSVYTGDQFNKRFQVQVRELDAQLNPSGKETICISPSLKWEGNIVNEGPFVMKHDGTYYLSYSAVGYMSPDYCIGYATAKSPLGPWTKQHTEGPILHKTPTVSGPGHHCFIDSPDHKELFIAYHTHQFLKEPGPPRQLAIDRVTWTPGATPNDPPGMEVGAATDTPQAMPSGSKPLVRGQSDEFSGTELDRTRWTVFGENPKMWKLGGGALTIQTEDGDVFEDRTDLSNLFLQYAPLGDFAVTTRVAIDPQKDYQQAFLSLWQDHSHYVKISFVHTHGSRKIEVGIQQNDKYTSHLHDTTLNKLAWLQIKHHGDNDEFLASADGKTWTSIESDAIPLIDLRVGIGACSPDAQMPIPAAFDFVHFSAGK